MKLSAASRLPEILFSTTAAVALAAQAEAQCQVATVEVIDASPANPVRLASAEPFPFPVLGSWIRFEAQGAQANSFGVLVLSRHRANLVRPGVLDGTLLVDALHGLQFPYVQVPSWTFTIPPWVLPGMTVYAQSIHSRAGGGYQLSNALELRTGFFQAEIAVVDVQSPASLVGGIGPAPHVVTLRNRGNAPATVEVTVRIGVGAGSTFATRTVGQVPAFGTLEATLMVPTPNPSGPCGSSFTYDVSACSSFVDCDPSNDCFLGSTRIATAYWDLDFDLVQVPSSAQRGTYIDWGVRIRNVGNVPSPANVGALTAINCAPGSRNFSCSLGTDFFLAPSIAPGSQWDRNVLGSPHYFIPLGAFTGTQYIKAEINYTDGTIDDICNDGNNNYAERPIAIL